VQLPNIPKQAMDGNRMEESVSRLPEEKELAMEEMTGGMTAAATFDADRAMLIKRDLFRPLAVRGTERLADALTRKKVAADTSLLLLERGGEALAVRTHQMIYHHVAQGELKGTPFLATF
jgi:hypothetical protein